MTNIPIQFFLKLFFCLARPDPKLIRNPKCYISLKSVYNLWKNIHLRMFIFGCRGLRNSPWKKFWQKNLPKIKYLYPPKHSLLVMKWKKTYFFTILIQLWVESWYYMSRLTQEARYDILKKSIFTENWQQ